MLDETKAPLPLLLPGLIQIQYICLGHLPSCLVIQLKGKKHHRRVPLPLSTRLLTTLFLSALCPVGAT